ncbi:MAG: chaperonin GroEL [Caldilineaceae bacterium]|nr:chaperonin GroEL [Caldilineaceae bacterium]
MTQPRLLFSPAARQALCRGFNQLSDLLEVSLGPRGRLVALANDNPRKAPELLNDGATIARRFLGLPDRFETMGAFLARHIAWRVEEAVGDGTTTAVVIARQILNEVERHAAAGFQVMSLRRGLEKAARVVITELASQAHPFTQPEQLVALGSAITGSETIGQLLEEIFDTVGPHGAIQVRTSYARRHERRYIQGTFWNQGWASSSFTNEPGKAALQQPYLLFTDYQLTKATDLVPLLNLVREAGTRGLVVIAPVVTGDALKLLVTNHVRKVLPIVAIKAPGLGPEKREILQDLAILCGGRLIATNLADQLTKVTLADLGQADEVQVIRSGFTIIGGKGRPAAIRQRHAELRGQIPKAQPGRERERLVERSGKLLGGVALLEIGGATESEQDYLKERAKEAIAILRLALQEGVAPGGGVAYLRCIPALEKLDLPEDEAPACAILQRALQAPARAILRNSGFEPAPILATLLESRNGTGFDVMRAQLVDVMATHLIDPVSVLQSALQIAVSGALMGATTETLVHRPRHNREEAVDFRP